MVMAVQMFPLVVLIIPLFVVMRNLEPARLLPGPDHRLPELHHAAGHLDAAELPRDDPQGDRGGGHDRRRHPGRRHVSGSSCPLAGPGSGGHRRSSAFIAAWNEFLFALTFITNDESRKPLPVVLQSFVGLSQADWGAIMAASVLFTIPVVIFFLVVQRRLTPGMVAGSVTG